MLRADAPVFIPSSHRDWNQNQNVETPDFSYEQTKGSSNEKQQAHSGLSAKPSKKANNVRARRQQRSGHAAKSERSGHKPQLRSPRPTDPSNADTSNTERSKDRRKIRDPPNSHVHRDNLKDAPSISRQLLPEAFPALATSKIPADMQTKAESVWSSTVSIKQSHIICPPVTEKGKNTVGRGSIHELTLLMHQPTKQIEEVASHNHQPAQYNNSGHGFSDRRIQQVIQQVTQPRNREKLRDRWWELLKNHRLLDKLVKDKHPEENAQECEDWEEEDDKSLPSTTDSSLGESSTSCDDSVPLLDPIYHNSMDPIYEAVSRDDEQALEFLLYSESDKHSATYSMQLAVQMNKPQLLRIATRAMHRGQIQDDDTVNAKFAILHAAEQGQDECLQIIGATLGAAVLCIKDLGENNVFHCFCRGTANLSTFRILTRSLATPQLHKLLSSTNQKGWSPLHIVCHRGRTDLVEEFLSIGKISFVSKLLSIRDKRGQTPLLTAVASGSIDCVMCLLMWRGNNHVTVHSANSVTRCPLVWAVRMRSALDMISLLLEFNSPTGDGYDLIGALHEAVAISSFDKAKGDIIRVLVDASANPCRREGSEYANCALVRLAAKADCENLKILVDTYKRYLASTQQSRRLDPVLQKQPESFFSTMEARERNELRTAMSDALLISLFHSFHSKDQLYLLCSLALYDRGAAMDEFQLDRLQTCLAKGVVVDPPPQTSGNVEYQTQLLNHVEAPVPKEKGLKMQRNNGMSKWMGALVEYCDIVPNWQECNCGTICALASNGGDLPLGDVWLIDENGKRFMVHERVVSQKCVKLAAAINFAKASRREDDVDMDIETKLPELHRQLLLQHIYHGSIISGLPHDVTKCSELLLELMLVGEEFLCWSLVQECELRLLSENPWACICLVCAKARYDYGSTGSDLHYRFRRPKLLSVESVLDVVAMAQHLQESIPPEEYCVWMSRIDGSAEFECPGEKGGPATCFRPLQALIDACMRLILKSFGRILKCPSLQHQLEGAPNTREILLEMCIEEFRSLPTMNVVQVKADNSEARKRNNLSKVE